MKQFTLGIGGIVVGAILVATFALTYMANANGAFTLPATTSNIATTTTVGPDTNVTVLSSKSDRMYAYIALSGADPTVKVYCALNASAANATNNISFSLGSTTAGFYEMDIEKNSYSGAVNCKANASTTVIISELLKR